MGSLHANAWQANGHEVVSITDVERKRRGRIVTNEAACEDETEADAGKAQRLIHGRPRHMDLPAEERDRRIESLLDELRHQGIRDERVLAAIGRVPRDRFVPESFQHEAWANMALPIGAAQTISQPYIVALMSTALELTGAERVLEIGAGSGYQAAILAELATEVISIERHPRLAKAAETLLHDLGYQNVAIQVADGSRGWPEGAPYDRIIVTAAAPRVPEALVEQLSEEGGRIVIPVGDTKEQTLIAAERRGDRITEQPLGPVRFVPLVGRAGWAVSVDENGHR